MSEYEEDLEINIEHLKFWIAKIEEPLLVNDIKGWLYNLTKVLLYLLDILEEKVT